MISAHFSCSSKRQEEFEDFQEFTNTKYHRILQPGQTRWLSLHRCVDRLLEQFNALKLYFTSVVSDDTTQTNQTIFTALEDPFTKPYLEFLKYALNHFNKMNALFQSERPLLYALEECMGKLILTFARHYLTDDFVNKFTNFPFELDPNPSDPAVKKDEQQDLTDTDCPLIVDLVDLNPSDPTVEKNKQQDSTGTAGPLQLDGLDQNQSDVLQQDVQGSQETEEISPYTELRNIYIGKLTLK